MNGELALLDNSKNSSAAFCSRPTLLNGSIIGAPLCRRRRENVTIVWCQECYGYPLFATSVDRGPLCLIRGRTR